jgi:hypothetical protein
MGISDYMYSIIECSNKLKIKLTIGKTIEIETIKQKHVDSIDNYGYVIDIDNFKCYYSGDSNEILDEILERFEEFCFFYQDTCIEQLADSPHLALNELCDYFALSNRNKVFCMHLDEKFDRNEAINLGFNVVTNEF